MACELILDFRGESITESIARLQHLAAEVIPLVENSAVVRVTGLP